MPSAAEATVTTMSNGAAVKSTRTRRAVAFARVAVVVVVVLILDQLTKSAATNCADWVLMDTSGLPCGSRDTRRLFIDR